MKKSILLFTLSLISLSAVSQSKLQKFFWSKRYKRCLASGEQLSAENQQLKKDTTALGEKFRNKDGQYHDLITKHNLLTDEHSKLKESYQYLTKSSDFKVNELSSTLESKSKELNQKEQSLMEKDKKLKELQSIVRRQDSVLNALNNTIKNALLGFKSDEFKVEMKNGKVYVSLSDKLLFKSGEASVEEKGKEAIKKLSEVLNVNTDIDIAIEGHTDSIPIKTSIYKDNWDLSVARSTNIVRMLCKEYNVTATRVTASGRAEFFPVASNTTSEGRAKNRRTEIVLSPKLEQLFKLLGNK